MSSIRRGNDSSSQWVETGNWRHHKLDRGSWNHRQKTFSPRRYVVARTSTFYSCSKKDIHWYLLIEQKRFSDFGHRVEVVCFNDSVSP
jgi:hypothetical protein